MLEKMSQGSNAVEVDIEVADDDVRSLRVERGEDLDAAASRFVEAESLAPSLAPRVATVLRAVMDGRAGTPIETSRTGSRSTARKRVSLVRGVPPRSPTTASSTPGGGRAGSPSRAVEVEIEVAEGDLRTLRIERGADLSVVSRRFVEAEGLDGGLVQKIESVLAAVLDGRVGSPLDTDRSSSRGTARRRVSLVRGVPTKKKY